MPDDHRPEITRLTPGELDRYANQLARCLKALDTRAPIRARVQRELAEVRAERDTRATAGQPATPAPLQLLIDTPLIRGKIADIKGRQISR